MNNNSLKELENMILYVAELNKKEIKRLSKVVDYIIESRIEDEHTISIVYDQLLSIMFVEEELIKVPYYKLLNYTSTFNKELSDDYEEIYIEQMEEDFESEEDKKLVKEKPKNN